MNALPSGSSLNAMKHTWAITCSVGIADRPTVGANPRDGRIDVADRKHDDGAGFRTVVARIPHAETA